MARPSINSILSTKFGGGGGDHYDLCKLFWRANIYSATLKGNKIHHPSPQSTISMRLQGSWSVYLPSISPRQWHVSYLSFYETRCQNNRANHRTLFALCSLILWRKQFRMQWPRVNTNSYFLIFIIYNLSSLVFNVIQWKTFWGWFY